MKRPIFACIVAASLLISSATLILAQSAPTQTPAPVKTKRTTPLDINTATRDELMALPGVGEIYALKIITRRPYQRKDELVTKGVMPKSLYNKIANLIVARHPGEKAK